jgi:hypothetical protein
MMPTRAIGVVLSARETSRSGRIVAIVALLSLLVRVAGLPQYARPSSAPSYPVGLGDGRADRADEAATARPLMVRRHESVSPRAGTVVPP